jgi:tripartite-type tricarboxylate transporter receptor subunit TctC
MKSAKKSAMNSATKSATKFSRRKLLHLASGAAVLPILSRSAGAVDYPTRQVHVIVGYPAGGAPDIMARLVGQRLSDRLGQQFVIDNRPGAASNIGTEIVAKAVPDGYTLLMAVSTNAVNATLYAKLNFNFTRDLVPVGSLGRTPFVMAVTPSLPAKTVAEFIAYARANPGKINLASQGIGTTPHVCGELLEMMTGIALVHVPYRGNLMPDLLAGQVHVYFSPAAQAVEYVKDGRLRALAVTTEARSEILPDVPTLGETVPGYVAVGWYGLVAPTGTKAAVIDKLNAEMTAAVADPAFRARLVTLGIEPKAMAPAEFGRFIADETAKWAKVIKFAGINPE